MRKIVYGIILLFVVGGSILFFNAYSHLGRMGIDTDNTIIAPPMENNDDEGRTEKNPSSEQKKSDKKRDDFYALMIGIDIRENQTMLNTDSIIVAHVIPEAPLVKLVSLPRDTKVQNSRNRDVKINSIFSEGYMHALRESRERPDLLSGKLVELGASRIPEEYISSGMVEVRTAVESFLEIDIDYMFLVNFETVVSLVDAVGGIEIEVDRSMRYEAEFDSTYIHLDEGWQTLNGEEALGYARFRLDSRGRAYDSNDFERGERQQQVMMALVDRLASWNSLPKALNLIDIVTANLKTDMNRSTMVSLVNRLYRNLDADMIVTVPFEGVWQSPYVLISDENLQQLQSTFKSTDVKAPNQTADESKRSETDEGASTTAPHESIYPDAQ